MPRPDPAVARQTPWRDSMVRQRMPVNALAASAVAEGVRPDAVAEALRAVGRGVDGAVSDEAVAEAVDAWSLALVRAVMDALLARQWSPRTATPWTLTHLVPALLPHLDPRLGPDAEGSGASTSPSIVDPAPLVADFAHAADQVWRSGDVSVWGDLLLAAVAVDAVEDRLPASLDGAAARSRLRDLGVVAAWRAGHVRLRTAAHRIGPTLPPAVLSAAVGLSAAGDSRPDAVHALRANADDPTAWPRSDQAGPTADEPGDRALRRLGGFTAYGGPFSVPPRVVDGDGVTWRLDAAGTWELLVDVHGEHLRRIPFTDNGLPAAGSTPVRSQRGRAVLVTSPRSHTLVYARAGHR